MTIHTVLWLVGEPGSGKTTLARTLLEPRSELTFTPKWTVGPTVVAAGHYSGSTFDGADTVPYNGARACLDYWHEHFSCNKTLTIFDGDRFSSRNTLARMKRYGSWIRLCCVLVNADPGVTARRRDARGSRQTASWVQGRLTKSFNFFNEFTDRLVLDGNGSVENLTEWTKTFISKGQL